MLVQAGSGGIGSFAIQLAKAAGAYVATTAGTPNVDLVRSLGADMVVDYKKQDFSRVLEGYDAFSTRWAQRRCWIRSRW